MKKTVNYCGNCPFYHCQYDDYAIGDGITNICVLAQNLKLDEYFISDDNLNYNSSDTNDSPEWCPLKKEEYSFNFKPFSKNKKIEINSISEQIQELNNYFDDIDDFESLESVEKDKEFKDLNIKLEKLLNNDESSFNDEDFQDEINNSISEIQKQMESIENATTQLNNILLNFNDENN